MACCIKLLVVLCILLSILVCAAPWYAIGTETNRQSSYEYYQLFYTYSYATCKTNDCEEFSNFEFWKVTEETKFTRLVFFISWLCSFIAMCFLFLSLSDKTTFFAPFAVIAFTIGIIVFCSLPMAISKDSAEEQCADPAPCSTLIGSYDFPFDLGYTWWSTSFGFAIALFASAITFVTFLMACCISCCCTSRPRNVPYGHYAPTEVEVPVYRVTHYPFENVPLMNNSNSPQQSGSFDYISQSSAPRYDPNVIVR